MNQYKYNFRGLDASLDPPDIPDPQNNDDELSVCCGANAKNEIDEDNMAICSYCEEWATFEGGKDDT